MPTAFVMAGGASLGAIEAGMLRALFERDIRPDLLVGTSAGALNAAFLATRPPTVETAIALGRVWEALTSRQVFPVAPLTLLLGLAGRRSYTVPDRGVRRLLREHLQLQRLEEARIALHVVTTDLLDGDEQRLDHGDAHDAVMASAAIPGIFPPVPWGNRWLVDGGIADNTPISQAVALGADELYVLPTGYACTLPEPPRGALATALQALTLMLRQRLADEARRYAGRVRLVVLPPPCPLDVSPTDFGRAPELILRGWRDAGAALDRDDPAGEGTERALERLEPHGHG